MSIGVKCLRSLRLFARLLDMIARTGLGVFGHQLLVLLPQGVHAVDHLLHQLDLRISEPVLIGNIIGDSSLTTRLPPGAPWLQLQLLATLSVREGLPWSTLAGQREQRRACRCPGWWGRSGGSRTSQRLGSLCRPRP